MGVFPCCSWLFGRVRLCVSVRIVVSFSFVSQVFSALLQTNAQNQTEIGATVIVMIENNSSILVWDFSSARRVHYLHNFTARSDSTRAWFQINTYGMQPQPPLSGLLFLSTKHHLCSHLSSSWLGKAVQCKPVTYLMLWELSDLFS